jgi:hypothetical protein
MILVPSEDLLLSLPKFIPPPAIEENPLSTSSEQLKETSALNEATPVQLEKELSLLSSDVVTENIAPELPPKTEKADRTSNSCS